MSGENELVAFLQLDRLILILSILSGAASAEFGFLETMSGLSKGNLSSKLKAAGLFGIAKSFRRKRPLTTLQITDAGRRALADYRQRLATVVANIPNPSTLKP